MLVPRQDDDDEFSYLHLDISSNRLFSWKIGFHFPMRKSINVHCKFRSIIKTLQN